jgi:hypothetical protein
MTTAILTIPRLGAREHEPLHRARHAHIQKSPQLLDLVLRFLSIAREPGIVGAEYVDARELQAFRGVKSKKIDSLVVGLHAIPFRQRDALEERADLILERLSVLYREQWTKTLHRFGISLIGRFVGAKSHQQILAAESLDEIVDVRKQLILACLTLGTIEVETATVFAERVDARELPEAQRFFA